MVTWRKTMTVEVLAQDLAGAWGENLVSVLLFGSAAAGDFFQGASDYNVLAVLKEASLSELKKAVPVIQRWIGAGNPAPLVFTEAGMMESADVFPIEFLDLKDQHKVLYGKGLAAALSVDPKNLRHQLENELKGKLLKLRQAYLSAGAKADALWALMTGSVSSFLVLFRETLRLYGEEPPRQKSESLEPLSRKISFDPGAFHDILAVKAGSKKAVSADAEKIFERYLRAIESVADAVDGLKKEAV